MPHSDALELWDGDIFLSPAAKILHDPQGMTNPYAGNPIDLTLFISCYNEAPFIATTLATACAALQQARGGGLTYEIIVIDDGSKDGSPDIVRRFIEDHPREPIALRVNKRNKGWAQNYLDAAFLGRGKYYRPICGDNSEPVETMLAVFSAIGEADIIVPYYISVKGRGQRRKVISKAYTHIINLLTGYRLQYYNGLAVHLRHNVMRWHSNTHGAGYQADILCMLLDAGFTYKEIPVTGIENREQSSSVLTFKNFLSVVHTLFEILLRRVSHWVYKR